MKKLLTACICSAILSGTVSAELFTVNGNQNGDVSDDLLNSIFQTVPTSYYIDENENGFVDNGEVVFDFGLGINIDSYTSGVDGSSTEPVFGGSTNDNYKNALDPSLFWGATMDYFLIGNAVVGGDGTFDSASDTLFANFNQGMLNYFVDETYDGDEFTEGFDREQLVLTYDVNSSSGTIGLVEIFGDLVYAEPGYFFRESGEDYADSIGSIRGRVAVNVDSGDLTSPIPGTVVGDGGFSPLANSFDTGTDDDFGLGPNGQVPVSYFGDSIESITRSANACELDEQSTFGYCDGSNTDIPFDPVTILWREIRDYVRALDLSGSPVLARTTNVQGSLYNEVSSPSSLAIFGLSLLGIGVVARRAQKNK